MLRGSVKPTVSPRGLTTGSSSWCHSHAPLCHSRESGIQFKILKF
ncbi:MAG: hypothetical protein ACEY3D_02725 [Rickettsia sp.]